jgi:hypothetical protein
VPSAEVSAEIVIEQKGDCQLAGAAMLLALQIFYRYL